MKWSVVFSNSLFFFMKFIFVIFHIQDNYQNISDHEVALRVVQMTSPCLLTNCFFVLCFLFSS